jgi:coiled-coil domain-containing protein 63/114
MSSMDKEIMKIFLKMLQVGSKYLNKEAQDPKAEKLPNNQVPERLTNKQVLLKYAQTILDKERFRELEVLINHLAEEDTNYQTLSSDMFLQIIKYFVLSPVEKNYINRIEQELRDSVIMTT